MSIQYQKGLLKECKVTHFSKSGLAVLSREDAEVSPARNVDAGPDHLSDKEWDQFEKDVEEAFEQIPSES